jgi:glycosyltransferase involved in cell wall biosynthesis
LKVLEAMSFGRPVVTTSVGAEGMDVMPGENIFVQDTPEGFAEAICVVLAYPEHARAVGLAGRALVEQQYSKEAARRKILHIYEQEADASLQTAGNC